MPGKITGRQLDGIVQWLEQKTDATCPFCGGRHWTVDDELSSMPAYDSGEARVETQRGHTLVLVTCEGCGFTAPFAAKKLAPG